MTARAMWQFAAVFFAGGVASAIVLFVFFPVERGGTDA